MIAGLKIRDFYGIFAQVTIIVLLLTTSHIFIYSQLVHVLNTCAGYCDHGIAHPSKESQVEMLLDFYKQCSVSPSSVDIVEAHGTGNVFTTITFR